MINSISFPNWGMAVLIALLSGLAYAFFLYYRESKFDKPSIAKTVLSFLRGFTVALIIILLFSPVVKSVREEVKPPLIVMAKDVSTSLLNSENNPGFDKKWSELSEDLENEFAVQNLEFAGQVSDQRLDSIHTKSTNLSALFRHIDDQYADQNVGAVIISSDGIFNEGSNPLYQDAFINTPLYIIARGDTTQYKDLAISDVFYNKIAYLGDKFTLQTDVKGFHAGGAQTRLTVEQIEGGNRKKVWEEVVSVNGNPFFTTKTIELEAVKPGLMKFRLSLSPLSDEKNKSNNYKDIFVEVLDGRQKVLILANSPHPDIAAIRQIMDENKNYEINVAYAGDNGVQVSKYDMVVLHNLPSERHPIKSELAQIAAKQLPVFYIVGMQTSPLLFNQSQEVLSISGNSKNSEDIQADVAKGFSSFTLSPELQKAMATFPPLLAPFGEYKSGVKASVLSYQNIKKIKTSYPQLLFGESKGNRVAVFAGEGLWRWKMADYVTTNSFENVKELLNKSFQWTSVKEDKRKFRVNTGKTTYRENEPVMVEAQLYNDNYELINEPDASAIIRDESGKEFSYTFSKTNQSYSLNAGNFAPGNYQISAKTQYNGRVLTAGHSFTIESMDLEQNDQVARHDVLASLVAKYGGKMVTEAQADSILTFIKNDENVKPTIYQSQVTKSVIHLKWLCFLLLLLLGLEWFIRRYLGSY